MHKGTVLKDSFSFFPLSLDYMAWMALDFLSVRYDVLKRKGKTSYQEALYCTSKDLSGQFEQSVLSKNPF